MYWGFYPWPLFTQQTYFSWWRHQMETISSLLALCAGNSPVLVNSLHKGQWHGALMFSLICVWINDWVNRYGAGDLRRHRCHYDVIVMLPQDFVKSQRRKIGCYHDCITLKFDRHFSINAAEVPVKFKRNWKDSTRISWLRHFMRSCGETSVNLVNRGPEWHQTITSISAEISLTKHEILWLDICPLSE